LASHVAPARHPSGGRARRALVAIAFLLLACARPLHAAPEGVMTWGVHVSLAARWLDPAETEGTIIPFMVLYALHDALVKPMPSGLHTPSLAESWTQSKDGLLYEFVLRKGVRFHNGDPVTAEDVKFSFERYRGSGARLMKEKVREVQVVDPGRVRFHLKEPWPDFMTYYGTTASGVGWVVPQRYVEQVGDDGFKKAPVGAGPYRMVSFTPGVELVAEAFEGYWRKAPHVKRLVFKVMPDDTTRGAALKKGDVDVIFQVNGPVAEDLRRTPHVRIVSRQNGNGVFWLDLPDQWDPRSPWHDRRVRQAASLALDRQAVNQAESLGTSRLTGSIIPRSFEFALPFDPPPHDRARARQLLAEAGYANGFDAGDFYPYPPLYAMGEALAAALGSVGIRTRIRTMERAAFLTAWREKKLRGVIMGLNGSGGNAATRLEAYVTRTGIYAYGVLPEVEDLFQRQAREMDRAKREALLHQIQRILHDHVMHVPVYELSPMAGISARVEQAGVGLILGYPYSGPYEDLKLKKP
jgi:peptide/nickel transport system substrate-binding protein